MSTEEIIALLPYSEPFLFVDEITTVSNKGITGTYTFKETESFYKGHFKNNPVTPGVILTECMAQIGLVSLGIYLLKERENLIDLKVAFTSSDLTFLKPVYPKEKVTVISEIEYFRFNKLKCSVKSYNTHNEIVCKGVLSGLLSV